MKNLKLVINGKSWIEGEWELDIPFLWVWKFLFVDGSVGYYPNYERATWEWDYAKIFRRR